MAQGFVGVLFDGRYDDANDYLAAVESVCGAEYAHLMRVCCKTQLSIRYLLANALS
jgi:hypothetical protein